MPPDTSPPIDLFDLLKRLVLSVAFGMGAFYALPKHWVLSAICAVTSAALIVSFARKIRGLDDA